MQELITTAERVKLYEAFRIAKKKREDGEHICHVLGRQRNQQSDSAAELVAKRIGRAYTLGMYMHKYGLPDGDVGQEFELFNEIRNFWLNMLINEHSSHDMYLLARYRDYLIAVRDRGFLLGAETIQWGFSMWCYNEIRWKAYQWLFKARVSKLLWKRTRNQECCQELQEFIHQEILEVTNILIQEPK